MGKLGAFPYSHSRSIIHTSERVRNTPETHQKHARSTPETRPIRNTLDDGYVEEAERWCAGGGGERIEKLIFILLEGQID